MKLLLDILIAILITIVLFIPIIKLGMKWLKNKFTKHAGEEK